MSLNQQQITDLLQQHFPQIQDEISIDSLNDQEATVRLSVNNRHLRPGNTVSGPSMFCSPMLPLTLRYWRKWVRAPKP